MNEAKPYILSYEDRDDYLYALVEGEQDSFEISMAFWEEIAAEAGRRGVRKLIVEETIPESVSFTDVFRIAEELKNLFQNVTVAFVDRYADQIELNQFGELVAQNRGVVGRFFADFKAAESWILKR